MAITLYSHCELTSHYLSPLILTKLEILSLTARRWPKSWVYILDKRGHDFLLFKKSLISIIFINPMIPVKGSPKTFHLSFHGVKFITSGSGFQNCKEGMGLVFWNLKWTWLCCIFKWTCGLRFIHLWRCCHDACHRVLLPMTMKMPCYL